MPDGLQITSQQENHENDDVQPSVKKKTSDLIHERGEEIDHKNEIRSEVEKRANKEFLPEATSEQQLLACYNTLQNVLAEQSNSDNEPLAQEVQAVIQKYIDLIKNGYGDKTLRQNDEFATRVIATTSVLLDLFAVNNISSTRVVGRGKTIYQRQGYEGSAGELPLPEVPRDVLAKFGYGDPDEFKNPYFMTHEEFKVFQAKTSWAKDMEFRTFDEIQEELNHFNGNNEWPPKAFLLNDSYVGILSSLKYDEEDQEAFEKIRILRESLHPISEIPRQEIWHSFLQKGKALFDAKYEYSPISEAAMEGEFSPSRQFILTEEKEFWDLTQSTANKEGRRKAIQARKGKFWTERGSESLEDLIESYKKNYAKVLGREHKSFGQPEVLLTRSGVSTNGAVIEAISKYYEARSAGSTEPKPIAYRMPGFFFENHKDIESGFSRSQNEAENLENATVFFVNYAPGVSGINFSEGYDAEREKVIAQVKKKAFENPNTPYFLVLDKTCNPLYSAFQSDEELPINLNIFETSSLTKHQRGGQNYFFGDALYWGDPSLVPLLQDAVKEKRGTLTPLSILNMPLMGRSELQENMEHVKKLGVAAAEELDLLQKDIPESKRWRIDNYSYIGYLIPPEDDDAEGDLEKSFLQLGAEEPEGIILGTSFGLNTTMLVSYESFYDVNAMRLRIGYGLQTTPEQMRDFIKKGFEREKLAKKEKEDRQRYEQYFQGQLSSLTQTLRAAYKTKYGHEYLEPLGLKEESLDYIEFAKKVPLVQSSQVGEDPLQFFTGEMDDMEIFHSGGTTGKPKEFYQPKKENFIEYGGELAKALAQSERPILIHGNWESDEFIAMSEGAKLIRPDTHIDKFDTVKEAIDKIVNFDMVILPTDITSFRVFISELDKILDADPNLANSLKDKQVYIDLNSEPVTVRELEDWHKRLKNVFGRDPGFSVSYGQNDTGNLGLYIYHPNDTQKDMKYKMHTNKLVEVIDEEGKLVIGKKGDLLITTFRDDGSIFLRYATGDQGVMTIDAEGNVYIGEIGRSPDAGMVSLWGEKLFFPDLYHDVLQKSEFPFQLEVQTVATAEGKHKDLNINIYGQTFDGSDDSKSREENMRRLILEPMYKSESFKRFVEIGMVTVNINFYEKAPPEFWKGWRKLPEQIVN